MKHIFFFITILFVNIAELNAQIPTNSQIIEVANKVYAKQKYKNFQIKNDDPIIEEQETIYLPPEKLNKIRKISSFGGAKAGCKYYIVKYPCDMKKYQTESRYCMQVYIWANSLRAFSVKLGNGIIFKENVGGNGKPDWEEKSRNCHIEYKGDTELLKNAPNSALYGKNIQCAL